jgi:hypothetical protein
VVRGTHGCKEFPLLSMITCKQLEGKRKLAGFKGKKINICSDSTNQEEECEFGDHLMQNRGIGKFGWV